MNIGFPISSLASAGLQQGICNNTAGRTRNVNDAYAPSRWLYCWLELHVRASCIVQPYVDLFVKVWCEEEFLVWTNMPPPCMVGFVMFVIAAVIISRLNCSYTTHWGPAERSASELAFVFIARPDCRTGIIKTCPPVYMQMHIDSLIFNVPRVGDSYKCNAISAGNHT